MKLTFMLFGNFGDLEHGKGMEGYYIVKRMFEEGMKHGGEHKWI